MAGKVISVEVTGLDKLAENLRRYGVEALKAMAAALYTEAEATMAESKEEVPVDTGALRASGTVALPEYTEGGVVVEMGYGGAAVDYAIFVHEDLTKHHPVGNAKFLEGPVNRRAAGMGERIGQGVARRLGVK
jgi:Bacteriophage HK97-gp10, putative tail-component